MPQSFYKVAHLLGLIMTFSSLGALIIYGSIKNLENRRRLVMTTHGIGIALLFVAGFGMIAKMHIAFPWPTWIWVKMGVWFTLASAPFWIRKNQDKGLALWLTMLTLGALAIFMVVTQSHHVH